MLMLESASDHEEEHSMELLTIREACTEARLSRSKVEDLLRRGAVPRLKIGRAVRIDRRRFEQYLETCAAPQHESERAS
jgi:excisionase family DNA binding protein